MGSIERYGWIIEHRDMHRPKRCEHNQRKFRSDARMRHAFLRLVIQGTCVNSLEIIQVRWIIMRMRERSKDCGAMIVLRLRKGHRRRGGDNKGWE
jgi:hypothetical protein